MASGGGKDGAQSREARLAAALRDNLRRRKAQGRARRAGEGAEGDDAADEGPDRDGAAGGGATDGT